MTEFEWHGRVDFGRLQEYFGRVNFGRVQIGRLRENLAESPWPLRQYLVESRWPNTVTLGRVPLAEIQ